jgi:hypothetical protein
MADKTTGGLEAALSGRQDACTTARLEKALNSCV